MQMVSNLIFAVNPITTPSEPQEGLPVASMNPGKTLNPLGPTNPRSFTTFGKS
jgi:hypothetical protein